MRLKIGLAVFLLLACAACSPRGLLVPVATETATEPPTKPAVMMFSLATPELPLDTPTLTQTSTASPTPTETFTPTLTGSETPTATLSGSETPTATPTELPTESPTSTTGTPIALETWTGEPTYPESLPGYLFRLDYDPDIWMMEKDLQDEPSLVHKTIDRCAFTRAVGRGLLPGWSVDDDTFKWIGTIKYEVVSVSRNGELQYVNYFGGDGTVFTGFQVKFETLAEDCLRDAETVLATLSSALVPTPTPTPTP
jgi:hypothetical protein